MFCCQRCQRHDDTVSLARQSHRRRRARKVNKQPGRRTVGSTRSSCGLAMQDTQTEPNSEQSKKNLKKNTQRHAVCLCPNTLGRRSGMRGSHIVLAPDATSPLRTSRPRSPTHKLRPELSKVVAFRTPDVPIASGDQGRPAPAHDVHLTN